MGLYAVVVDAKHDKAKAFYTKLGFIACMDNPLALYLPVATLEQAVVQKVDHDQRGISHNNETN